MKVNEVQDPVAFSQNVNLKPKPAAARPVPQPVPAQQEQNEFIELDLEKLIKFGVVERDIPIGETVFKMRTLTEGEKSAAEAKVPSDMVGDDDKTMNQRITILKIPILIQSIIQINSVSFEAPESKKTLEDLLNKMQSPLVTRLFVHYLSLVTDQQQLFESGVKKNSQ
jgi:hypothetical protein